MATRAFFVLAKLSNIKCQQNIRQCLVKGRQVFPPMLYQQCHLPYSIARLLQGGKEAQACTTDAGFFQVWESPLQTCLKKWKLIPGTISLSLSRGIIVVNTSATRQVSTVIYNEIYFRLYMLSSQVLFFKPTPRPHIISSKTVHYVRLNLGCWFSVWVSWELLVWHLFLVLDYLYHGTSSMFV